VQRRALPAHDRADRDDLPLTHEFLALMLGTEGIAVGLAARLLPQSRPDSSRAFGNFWSPALPHSGKCWSQPLLPWSPV